MKKSFDPSNESLDIKFRRIFIEYNLTLFLTDKFFNLCDNLSSVLALHLLSAEHFDDIL
jgi:hypothetical protein